MTKPNIQVLRTTIDDLKSRLDAMPECDFVHSPAWEASWAERKRAADEIAAYLTATYGARIVDKAWTHTIRMHGISSSCISGLTGLFWNWLRAAECRLAATPVDRGIQ